MNDGIKYWIFRLDKGERLRCNECKILIHKHLGETERPIMIFQEAIRSDDTIGEAMCEKCAKEKCRVTVDRENHRLIVQRP